MASPAFHSAFRKYHRWLGFFLAGVMTLYALSGVLLIFRTTDVLKFEQTEQKQLAPGLSGDALGPELRLRGFKVNEETTTLITFKEGQYNKESGLATVTRKDYPAAIAKVVGMHKATTNSPLFFLNIAFGAALLFFSVSAFLMFMPRVPQFKNGLKIAAGGFLLALLVVIFS
ncbi:hypothetical protein [Halioxenophilus aromaticivorans]|uniref:PepSY domain-containing protein n=1 Tax=Halioxenophilus aromaticivorans TaxID=1306992 RepID=A0AAV3U154_9ALTE